MNPVFVVLLVIFTGVVARSAEASRTNAPSRDELFSPFRVLTIKIELPSGNLEALKTAPKVYVKGTVREGEKMYGNVGVRLKGNASFQSQEKKPSLALKFNEFVSSQLFHGHGKVFLENGHQDPTLLSEAMGIEVFRAADVPVAKVTFARVELNGRDLGLYLLEEAVNREFLLAQFKKSKGNLYEGTHSDVTDKLEQDSGEATDQADVKKLAAASKDPDPVQRLRKLGTVLDVDRFISFAAAEVLTWHRNGYIMGQNNYRLYHDPNSERMVFIPHGLELLFNKPNGALLPEWKGVLAKAVLETPDGQRRYRERMAALLAGPCKVEMLQGHLNVFANKLRPELGSKADDVRAFETAVALLRERITQRVHFLEDELRKSGR